MAVIAGGGASALWRRAIQALAQAFDPAREGEESTVFQTNEARSRAVHRLDSSDVAEKPLRPSAPHKETLQ
jgi:hypothetical protein